MQVRSRQDIVASILDLLHEPRRLTRIMYGANMSYSQVRMYIELLDSAGLIRQEDNLWIITDKGRIYLKLHRESTKLLEPLLSPVERELNPLEQIRN